MKKGRIAVSLIAVLICFVCLSSAKLMKKKEAPKETVKQEKGEPKADISKPEGSKDEEVELEVVWEKQFDDPVVDVIFDETEMTVKEAKAKGWKNLEGRKDNEKVKVEYPKAIIYIPDNISLKTVSFLKSKKIINMQTNQGIIFSNNRRYLGIINYPDEHETDAAGGIIYEGDTEIIIPKSMHSPIAISDDGYLISTIPDCCQAPPEPGEDFYLSKLHDKEVKVIANPLKKQTAPYYVKISQTSEYALLGYESFSPAPSAMILLTITGGILWTKELPYTLGSGETVEIIPNKGVFCILDEIKRDYNGKIILFNSFRCMINWQGKIEWCVPMETRGNINIKISPDNKRAYIISSRGYLFCVDLKNGTIIWKYKEDMAPYGVVASMKPNSNYYQEIELIGNKIIILASIGYKQDNVWDSSRILIFNDQGKKLKELSYENKKIQIQNIKNKLLIIDKKVKKAEMIKVL